MMFSIRSFVLYAVGTSMCGGLLVLLCLPLCALLRRLRAPSKLLCLLWLAVGLRFLLPGGIPVSIRQPSQTVLGVSAFEFEQREPWVEEDVEFLDADFEHPRHDEVTHLVNAYQDGETEEELNDFYKNVHKL